MLTKAQRKKVYERISRRYRRLAEKLGKNWKEIELDGLCFQDAYQDELRKEETLQKKGEESRLRRSREDKAFASFDPEKIGGGIKRREDYFSSPDFDPRELGSMGKVWGADEEPTREEKMKKLERKINQELEEQATRNICPKCRSSCCHCETHDSEEEE